MFHLPPLVLSVHMPAHNTITGGRSVNAGASVSASTRLFRVMETQKSILLRQFDWQWNQWEP